MIGDNPADDPRTDEMKSTMARHFAENESDYRDNDWGEIVYEDSECVVIADHKGYEFDEWADEFDGRFSEAMHELAREKCSHSWGSAYPVVFEKENRCEECKERPATVDVYDDEGANLCEPCAVKFGREAGRRQ